MKRFCPIIAAVLALSACASNTIYVSPDGKDTARGTKGAPVASAAAAMNKASAYAYSHPEKNVVIIFADGVYPVTETLKVTGNANPGKLTFRAAEGANPVFSGEKEIGGWQKVTDERALKMLPCPDNVLQADLKEAGVTDFGKPVGDEDRFDLYYNGKRQTLAMWPNEGFSYAGKALGKTPHYNYLGDSFSEPVLQYVDSHIDNWADEPEPCLHGYWGYDWFDMYNPVEIDKAAKKLTIGGDSSPYGYRTGCRFRGVNLLSELDMPGEYWVDRDKGLIFWYAPAGFNGEGTTVSNFSGDYMIVVETCYNVLFKGLELSGSRGGAVSIKDGAGITFEDCTFKRFAKDVINVNKGYTHKFNRCTLSELGCAGIILNGGDRRTLDAADFEVHDCTIENLSLYRKTYQPCIRVGGCGIFIYNNLFRNCPSSALRLDGNDIEVTYNIFEDLVTESDDQGGIDVFNNYTFRGIEITHNYFHNIGDPEDNIAGGVRFDDRISGMLVENNVFDHCGSSGFGGVQIHGGQDNIVRGNVFYDCTYAVSSTPWDVDNWNEKNESEREMLGLTPEMDSLTDLGQLYLKRYPEIAHMLDESLVNRNYVLGNLVVKTPLLLNMQETNFIMDGNTMIPDDGGQGLEHWISDEVLDGYGIVPVEFEKMGPRR